MKENDPLDELVRLQVMQLRRTLGTQAEVIVELGQAGFGQARIADLLGTTPGTVRVALQRARKRPGGGKTSLNTAVEE